MKKLIVFFLLIISAGKSFGQEPAKAPPPARPLGFVIPADLEKVSIPFEVYNNLIVIDVLLNRSLPLKFVFDTGVRTTVLAEKSLADLLNLTYSRKITIPGAGGEKVVDAFVANNVSLSIGRIQGTGHAMLVLEEDLLQLKNYLGVNVHGILGYELFNRFVVEINYNKRIITFYRPKDFRPKGRFKEIPLQVVDTKPYIQGRFVIRGDKEVSGKFMLDTGASHSLLMDKDSSPDIFVPEPNIRSILGRGLSGNIHGQLARIDRFAIDGFVFEEVICSFPDSGSYEVAGLHNIRNGTLGGGILSRFHLIMDYRNGKLYLRKGVGYKKPFEFNLSGLIIRAKGVYLNEYVIDFVRENSSADKAGLQIGDEILEINNIPAYKLNLEQLLEKLNSKNNKTVKLTVLRGNKTIRVQFRLFRLI